MKFMKRVSTGKVKDYSLKNFTFEEDIKKDGSIDDIIKSNQSI
jgi:ribonuclease G